jgi:TPR repeat protein
VDERATLPQNTILDGSYRIERVIGSGGFGITYEVEDVNLGSRFALKEYYPFDFGNRDATMSVRPKSDAHKKTFEWGRLSFLQEARMLARFKHPSVVRVTRVFEAYSTAYMVMELEPGKNFEVWLNDLGRAPSQEELDRIAGPLLDALQLMHAENFLHRDIAPDNIIIRADGSPVLLDFGAARRAVGEMSRSLTGIVKAGYSPHEQYAAEGRLQGPWSDLYAFGATLYRAVAGKAPEEATIRMTDNRTRAASEFSGGGYRPSFLAAIDTCLQPKLSDRHQSVAQLRPMLLEKGPGLNAGAAFSANRKVASNSAPGPMAGRWLAISAGFLAISGGIYGGFEYTRWDAHKRLQFAMDAKREVNSGATGRKSEEEDLGKSRTVLEKRAADERERHETERARLAAEEKASDEKRLRATIAEHAVQTGDRYFLGRGVLRDYAKAREAYEKAASGGNSGGMNSLGWMYERGLGVDKDYGKAREWYIKAAAAGSIPAISNVGRTYREGWGVPRDYAQAREWFEKAAAVGNSSGMHNLGWLYENGWGVQRDYEKARQWYEKGAAEGNAFSMAQLGWFYRQGLGGPQDYGKAREWSEKAIAVGYGGGMNNLGVFFENGNGVPQDYSKAREWYEKAAAAGHDFGKHNLARLLDQGKGGPADYHRAAKLLLEAAKLNNPSAIADLRGSMAQWNSNTRDELKRELFLQGHFNGALPDKWDDDARAAVEKYLRS